MPPTTDDDDFIVADSESLPESDEDYRDESSEEQADEEDEDSDERVEEEDRSSNIDKMVRRRTIPIPHQTDRPDNKVRSVRKSLKRYCVLPPGDMGGHMSIVEERNLHHLYPVDGTYLIKMATAVQMILRRMMIIRFLRIVKRKGDRSLVMLVQKRKGGCYYKILRQMMMVEYV